MATGKYLSLEEARKANKLEGVWTPSASFCHLEDWSLKDHEYTALMEWDKPFKFIARDKIWRAAIEI